MGILGHQTYYYLVNEKSVAKTRKKVLLTDRLYAMDDTVVQVVEVTVSETTVHTSNKGTCCHPLGLAGSVEQKVQASVMDSVTVSAGKVESVKVTCFGFCCCFFKVKATHNLWNLAT